MNNATGTDTSNLAAESDFVILKSEIDKLNILVNVWTGLNDLKTKVFDLDVSKLKTFPIELKNVSDTVNKEVFKSTKLRKLNIKVNSLQNKIHDAAILIDINLNNTNKEMKFREKKLKWLIAKYVVLVV